MQSPELHAFLAAARSWHDARDEVSAARMLRSPFSGVPAEIGAAYAALAAREGSLLDLLGRERIAVGGADRDALIAFASALRDGTDFTERTAATIDVVESAHGGPFKLAQPAAAEAAAGVPNPGTRFSASQLNAYAECPRKWYYRYVCSAVEDKGSAASYYGTAFHAALESFHHEFPQPGQADAAELDRKLQGYVNTSFDKFRNVFETPVEHELQVRRARRTARKYLQWLLAESRRSPFTIVGCEVSVETNIEGFDFVGYIDRMDRDDRSGGVRVVDYKTGSIATSAAEYREKVRLFKDFQLPFYYWARTAAGDRVWKLALVPLKDALLDVRPIVLEVVPVPADIARNGGATGVIPLAELERARARMVEICRELSAGTMQRFAVTDDPSACKFCSYRLACAEQPYPDEERFAR